MSGRQLIRASALLLVCLLSRRAAAQSTTSLLPDATVLPKRALRFRGLSAWTRYDQVLGDGGPRNVAGTLATDSLTTDQVPAFSASQLAIRDASGLSNFRLTAGRLSAAADSRIVTAPLIMEYGLSSRLTVGVVIPLVETRTTLAYQLNPKLGSANVGVNPAQLAGSDARAQNTAFIQSMILAASTLQSRLSSCQATPGGTGCSSLLTQQAAVQSLIQSTGTFAASLSQLYGTSGKDSATGQALVPLKLTLGQVIIDTKIQSIRDQYQAFLGTDVLNGTVAGANGPAANLQLLSLLKAAGYDSLQSTDHASIGDITIGATYQLANTFGDTSAGAASRRHYRLAANGTFRIGTGQPAIRNRLFDLSTGYGQPGVEGGVAADLQLAGRWSASAIGSYTLQFGSVAVDRIPNAADAAFPLALPVTGTYSAGNVMSLSVVPRYRLSGDIGITGRYSILHVGADQYTPSTNGASPSSGLAAATAQQVGFGITYSTIVGSDRGPGRIPFEASFTHLETITGSGGPAPKAFRDQIEVRVYFLR